MRPVTAASRRLRLRPYSVNESSIPRLVAEENNYDRLYYAQHEDKMKEYARQYYLQHDDEVKASKRQYRLQNGDKKREYLRQYHLENNASKNDYAREYFHRNKDKKHASIRIYDSQNGERRKSYLKEYGRQNRSKMKESSDRYRARNSDYFNFSAIPRASVKSWKSPEVVRKYFDSIADRLHITSLPDWYRISSIQIRHLGGHTLYEKFSGLGGALQYAYPEFEWDLDKFAFKGKKSEQRWLRVKIEELLPGVEIIEDYQHPDLYWDRMERLVELDLWIPRHGIGLEYQGEQHYHNLNDAFGPANLYWDRDLEKRELCRTRGVTLLAIPYWWDGSIDSLSATLYNVRPDVFPLSAHIPIPAERPTVPQFETTCKSLFE